MHEILRFHATALTTEPHRFPLFQFRSPSPFRSPFLTLPLASPVQLGIGSELSVFTRFLRPSASRTVFRIPFPPLETKWIRVFFAALSTPLFPILLTPVYTIPVWGERGISTEKTCGGWASIAWVHCLVLFLFFLVGKKEDALALWVLFFGISFWYCDFFFVMVRWENKFIEYNLSTLEGVWIYWIYRWWRDENWRG